METGTFQEMLIFLLRNGTAVLIVGRSRQGRDGKKIFIMMRGIYRREIRSSTRSYPAIMVVVGKILVDSG